MILFIDTSDFEVAELRLIQDDKILKQTWRGKRLSETLLPKIKQLLNRINASFDDIDKIVIVTGPGHFSRIRSSVAVANALAFGLRIKLVGLKKNEVPKNLKVLNRIPGKSMVLPFYGKEPNITKSKKKYL